MIIRKSIINGLIYIVTNKDKNSYSYRNDNIDKYPDNCEFYILNPKEPVRNISWKGSVDSSNYMLSIGKDNLSYCRIVPGDIIVKSSSKELLRYSIVDKLDETDYSVFNTMLNSPIKSPCVKVK